MTRRSLHPFTYPMLVGPFLAVLVGCGTLGLDDGADTPSPVERKTIDSTGAGDDNAVPPQDQAPAYSNNLTEATVKQSLMETLGIAATAIGVRAQGGQITLTGFVETEAEKARAIAAAREVQGVNRVDDRIEVK